jgi:hypothetical protein
VLEQEEELSSLLASVDRLEDRDATMLRLWYGLGVDEPFTLAAIGEQLGLTRERVKGNVPSGRPEVPILGFARWSCDVAGRHRGWDSGEELQ